MSKPSANRAERNGDRTALSARPTSALAGSEIVVLEGGQARQRGDVVWPGAATIGICHRDSVHYINEAIKCF